MAETSIQKARRRSKERIAAREAEIAAGKNAATEASKPKVEKKGISLIDRIRAAFSSEEQVNRIDSALAAIEGGIDDADKDSEREK